MEDDITLDPIEGGPAIPPDEVQDPTEDKDQVERTIKDTMGKDATDPALSDAEKNTAVKMEIGEGEEIKKEDFADLEDIELETKQAGDPTLVTVPDKFDPTTYDPTLIDKEDVGTFDAAKGEIRDENLVDFDAIKGEVSDESIAEAAQGEVSEESTVRYQMAELTASIEEGKPLPPWASPTARKVAGIMQQRGLGTSSMAAAAMTQAILEAGIPIAQSDAATYAAMDLRNLDNRQAAALQNAATYAAMDRANLDARTQAAITNAQSFLAMDLQNLSNEQKSREVTYQAQTQAMFNNQAAENAAAQFNAKSQNEVDMFFTELGTQVATSNANRVAATEQFNVGQANAMSQFQASLNSAREQFNTNLDFQIENSNAEWRRSINTQNTAAENSANQQNVQNAFAKSQNAVNNLWQEYRDELAWAFTNAENELSRQHELTLYALQQAHTMDVLDEELEGDIWRRVGERLVDKILPG